MTSAGGLARRRVRKAESGSDNEGGITEGITEIFSTEIFISGPSLKKPTGKAYYMISAVAQKYNIHPQTLRLYEREGLLKPSRTDGNTRLYSEDDLEQLETILSLTRDLGVNLAGVEIILNMRRKIEQMQGEVNEFMEYVKREMARGIDDWEQRLSTALVKSSPTDLVRTHDKAKVRS
jgi:MerR family transcriptional regulator/heat shock protein HspR